MGVIQEGPALLDFGLYMWKIRLIADADTGPIEANEMCRLLRLIMYFNVGMWSF